MPERQLFDSGPEVIHLNATFVRGQGWSLTVVARSPGECWDEAYRSEYERLSRAELVDVMSAETTTRLRLA